MAEQESEPLQEQHDDASQEPAVSETSEAPQSSEPVAEAPQPSGPVAEQRCSASEEEGWQTVKPKRRGRPPGSRNKPKIVAIAHAPEVIEEEVPEPPVQTAPVRTRRQAPEERQPVYFAPPVFGHRDLGSILSEHLLQVETQKRLSQQEMYARLERGVL